MDSRTVTDVLVLLLDASQHARNEDFSPSRLVAQQHMAILISHVHEHQHITVANAAGGSPLFSCLFPSLLFRAPNAERRVFLS